jgi:hypothetical protein
MTHWKLCSLLLPKPAVPMGKALSQLLISEATEPSRTSNSGSATVSTLAHGPQFSIAEASCKGSPDQRSRAHQLSSKKIWNTSTNRCTNHPMRCSLCKINLKGEQSTVWSYNFVLHVWDCHTIDGLGTVPPVTPETWTESYVSKAEETSMGVDLALTEAFQSCNDVPNSDDLDDRKTTQESDEDNVNMAGGPSTALTKRVRPRSETILSTTSFQAQGHRRKTHKVE